MSNSARFNSTLLLTFSPVETFMFSWWSSSHHGPQLNNKHFFFPHIWLTFRLRKITWPGSSCSCIHGIDKSNNVFSYEIQVSSKNVETSCDHSVLMTALPDGNISPCKHYGLWRLCSAFRKVQTAKSHHLMVWLSYERRCKGWGSGENTTWKYT